MPEPLNNVNTGDVSPLLNQKNTINAVLEATRRARETRFNTPPTGGKPIPAPTLPPSLRIWIRNDTADDLDALSIVKVGDCTINLDDTDDPYSAVRAPCFVGAVPGSSDDVFAVLTDAIAVYSSPGVGGDGYSYGRAVVMGVVICDVDVTDITHQFASPVALNVDNLASGTSGSARILSTLSETGVQTVAVLLCGQGGETSSGSIDVEEADGTPSYTGITKLRFDQDDGFVISNPSGTIARIDINPADGTHVGVVTTSAQTFAGTKTGVFSSDNFIGTNSGTSLKPAASNTLGVYVSSTASLSTPDGALWAGSLSAAGIINGGGGFYVGSAPGVSGSFISADFKTVTVTLGIITSIV